MKYILSQKLYIYIYCFFLIKIFYVIFLNIFEKLNYFVSKFLRKNS